MVAPTKDRRAGRGKTAEERAAKVETLSAQLDDAVVARTTSEAWLAMLRVSAQFTRYSAKNVLMLWMQAEDRGVTLSRVAGYRAWQSMGRQVVKGARSFAVLAPVRRRLTTEEATERAKAGQAPSLDADGRPALAVRGSGWSGCSATRTPRASHCRRRWRWATSSGTPRGAHGKPSPRS